MNYLPHSHCVFNDAALILTDVAGNAMTASAYFLIPILLAKTVQKLWGFLEHEERLIFIDAGLFIFLCGSTHVLKVWNWWHSAYWVEAGADLLTGLISLKFARRLYRYMRKKFE